MNAVGAEVVGEQHLAVGRKNGEVHVSALLANSVRTNRRRKCYVAIVVGERTVVGDIIYSHSTARVIGYAKAIARNQCDVTRVGIGRHGVEET